MSSAELSFISYILIWAKVFFHAIIHWTTAFINFFIPKSPKSVKGQLVLITGGSQGLGRAIAFRFAKEGCNVAIANRNLVIGEQTAADISNIYRNVKVKAFKCDVSKVDEVKRLQKEIKSWCGVVDILINNAGLLGLENSLLEGNDDEIYQKFVDVNFTSYIWTSRAFLPDMIRQKRGHIVGISSLQYVSSIPAAVTYCATKYGNAGFINGLREDICFYGYDDFIKLTTAYPSFVDTSDELSNLMSETTYKNIVKLNDVNMVADEIVNAILKDKDDVFVPLSDTILFKFATLLPRKVKTLANYMTMRADKRDDYIEMRRKKLNL